MKEILLNNPNYEISFIKDNYLNINLIDGNREFLTNIQITQDNIYKMEGFLNKYIEYNKKSLLKLFKKNEINCYVQGTSGSTDYDFNFFSKKQSTYVYSPNENTYLTSYFSLNTMKNIIIELLKMLSSHSSKYNLDKKIIQDIRNIKSK